MAEFCANIGCFCHQNALRESFEQQEAEKLAKQAEEAKKEGK